MINVENNTLNELQPTEIKEPSAVNNTLITKVAIGALWNITKEYLPVNLTADTITIEDIPIGNIIDKRPLVKNWIFDVLIFIDSKLEL